MIVGSTIDSTRNIYDSTALDVQINIYSPQHVQSEVTIKDITVPKLPTLCTAA